MLRGLNPSAAHKAWRLGQSAAGCGGATDLASRFPTDQPCGYAGGARAAVGGDRPYGSVTLEDARDANTDRATTPWVRTVVTGVDIQRHPKYNKGLAFGEEERDQLYLRGLLPPAVLSQDLQVERVMINVRSKSNDLDRHGYLMGLQERNERLFFKVLLEHTRELLPVVDLPTVGAFCKSHGLMFRSPPRGLYLGLQDRGRVYSLLKNWPERRVKAICLTDGERVGGHGDLGIHAIGCAISKLALYTACAGVPPSMCLPICLDTGTDNEELLSSPFYVGARHRRVRGEDYRELLEETLEAVAKRYGSSVLIAGQDMTYLNLASFLSQYRGTFPVYSDEIQGVAAVVVAGILAAQPLTGRRLSEHTYLFAGEGRGATAAAEVTATAIARETGQTIVEARKRIWLIDSEGLVTRARADTVADHKLAYAQEGPPARTALEAIRVLKPSVYLDIASMGDALVLSQEACAELAACSQRPMLFALSQPPVLSPEDAFAWTEGRCIYTDGDLARPSDARIEGPNGQRLRANVAQTAAVFPGIGLGAIMSRSTRIRDEMIVAAAQIREWRRWHCHTQALESFFLAAFPSKTSCDGQALARMVTDDIRAEGGIYPEFTDMRTISAVVARAVAARAYDAGVASEVPKPRDLLGAARSLMYSPSYQTYIQ